MDNALTVTTGHGLDKFVVTSDMEATVSAYDWPDVTVAADQGSDGLAAANACQFGPLRMGLETLDDDDHGDHNDMDDTIVKCGLYPHQKLMELARNAHQGPWGEGRRHIEIADAVGE